MEGSVKFNKCDIGIGASYSVLLWWVIGTPLAILSAVATAFLWSLGGIGWRVYRYLGCVAVICWFSWWGLHDVRVLYCAPVAIAWLTTGYSVPDVNQTKASRIGLFWMDIYYRMEQNGAPISNRGNWVNQMTRGTYGFVAAASWVVAPIVGLGSWKIYFLTMPLMALAFTAAVTFLTGEIEL